MQVQTATLIPLAWVTDFMQKTLQSAIIVMWIWYIKQTHQKIIKRQESITQAQAVTKVPGIEDMDEWFLKTVILFQD